MSAGADKAVLRAAVMAALEQAAREESKAFNQNRFCVCDRSSTGALVPRISYISGLSGAVVRRYLRAARDAGQVIERAPSYKGGMSRWWPVGLWDKLQAEKAAVEKMTKDLTAELANFAGKPLNFLTIAERIDSFLTGLDAQPSVKVIGSQLDGGVLHVELEMPRWLAIETGLVKPEPIDFTVTIERAAQDGAQ